MQGIIGASRIRTDAAAASGHVLTEQRVSIAARSVEAKTIAPESVDLVILR